MRLKESEKKELQHNLKKHTAAIVKALQDYDVDGLLGYHESKMMGNWFIYEDLRDKDKEWVDKHGSERIPLSRIIDFTGNRAINKIEESQYIGKLGENAEAVIFIRLLTRARQEHPCFGQSLYRVSAIFANLLYGTEYDDSSARQIVLN